MTGTCSYRLADYDRLARGRPRPSSERRAGAVAVAGRVDRRCHVKRDNAVDGVRDRRAGFPIDAAGADIAFKVFAGRVHPPRPRGVVDPAIGTDGPGLVIQSLDASGRECPVEIPQFIGS